MGIMFNNFYHILLTAASSKEAILFKKAIAARTNGIANAAPVPSPSRIPKLSKGAAFKY